MHVAYAAIRVRLRGYVCLVFETPMATRLWFCHSSMERPKKHPPLPSQIFFGNLNLCRLALAAHACCCCTGVR